MKNDKEQKTCEACGQTLLKENEFEKVEKITLEAQEKIISEIKEKAIKATMAAIKPLLDKLEEASKQQPNNNTTNIMGLSPEDQIKKMQEAANDKMKMREVKIQEKMKSLQAKIAKSIKTSDMKLI